jgi:MFS family permease
VTGNKPSPDSTVIEAASTFSPLRHTIVRAMWASNLLSQTGTMIQVVGAAWLMTSLSHSANMVALEQTSTSSPIVFFSLAAGAIADLHDERLVMIAAQLFMMVTSILIGIMTWTGQITPHLLLGLMFLVGCGAALNNPAWQASIREQVPTPELGAAIALNSVALCGLQSRLGGRRHHRILDWRICCILRQRRVLGCSADGALGLATNSRTPYD